MLLHKKVLLENINLYMRFVEKLHVKKLDSSFKMVASSSLSYGILEKLPLFLKKVMNKSHSEKGGGSPHIKKIKNITDELITGLLIEEDHIKWSVFQKEKQKYEWLKSTSTNFDTRENAASTEQKILYIASTIETNLTDFQGYVSFVIPSQKLLLQILDFPTKEIDELEGMVQLQVDKQSPYSPDETTFSYEVLHSFEQSTRVLIAIIKKDYIDEVKNLIDGTGLNIQRIDIEPLALWHSLHTSSCVPKQGRHFFIYADLNGGLLLCTEDGNFTHCKNILPFKDLSKEDIALDLIEESQNMQISMELYHGVKPLESIHLHLSLPDTEYILNTLKYKFSAINIVILEEKIDITTSAVRRFLSFQENQKLKKKKSNTRAVIPLIDFVPLEWRKIASEIAFRKKLWKASFMLLAIWLIITAGITGLHSFEEKRTQQLTQESATLSIPANQVRLLNQRIREFEKYIDRSKSLLDYLLEITKLMPQEITLTSFQYTKSKTIIIRGESLTANPILDFKQALDKSYMFSAVDMGNIMPAKRKETTVQSFQITIHLEEQKTTANNQKKLQNTGGEVKIGSSASDTSEMEMTK